MPQWVMGSSGGSHCCELVCEGKRGREKCVFSGVFRCVWEEAGCGDMWVTHECKNARVCLHSTIHAPVTTIMFEECLILYFCSMSVRVSLSLILYCIRKNVLIFFFAFFISHSLILSSTYSPSSSSFPPGCCICSFCVYDAMPPPKGPTQRAIEVTRASELVFVMWSSLILIILSVSGRATHPGVGGVATRTHSLWNRGFWAKKKRGKRGIQPMCFVHV